MVDGNGYAIYSVYKYLEQKIWLGGLKLRIDLFCNPENVLHDTQNENIGTGYVQKMEPDKSLFDYYFVAKETESNIPSFLYTKDGNCRDLLNVKPINYCKMAENSYPFNDSRVESEDVWRTVDEKGRKTTPYMKYNKDKVNYLIHYYLERGGDMETYPFESDDKETQTAYKHLVEFYACQAIEESRFRSVFVDSGIDTATITVDAKGEIKIEAKDHNNLEELENVKKKLTEFGKAATAFRNIIFREGQQYASLPGEKKNELSSIYYTSWILYRHYGLRVEDLCIQADGSIAGLTEEVYNDYEYRSDSDFYKNIIKRIERGGSSEDEIGRIVYKEGNIFIL